MPVSSSQEARSDYARDTQCSACAAPDALLRSWPLRIELTPGYKHLEDIHGHLDQFIGGHFSDVNLSALLYAHRIDDEKHITIESWSAPGLSKPLFAEAKKQKYKPAHKGEMFGPSWVRRLALITHLRTQPE